VGRDVGELLQAGFERAGLTNISIDAFCNDTTGTLAAARYAGHTQCIGGMVLGTGWNAAMELPVDAITKLKGAASEAETMIVNTEWENYALSPLTEWDSELNTRKDVGGKQLLEKHVSGKYLGEIARVALKDLIAAGELFGGKKTAIFDTASAEDKLGQDGFTTEHMSVIRPIHQPTLPISMRYSKSLALPDSSDSSIETDGPSSASARSFLRVRPG